MSVRSKTVLPKGKNKEYPKLMSFSTIDGESFVVLFNGPSCGMVVDSNTNNCRVGTYCDDWAMYSFNPLEYGSSVTITQDIG